MVAEILYGLQRRCEEGIQTHRSVLRPLCDDLRRTQAGSILGLPGPGRRQRRDLLRSLADHCRVALSSPDAEQAKDRWDLRVFGHRGGLDFTVIRLGWLRTVARRWAAEDMPRRRGRNAANIWQYILGSLAELDASLRLQRDDHGEDPALLGRRDIVAFTNRLAFLQQNGTISLNRRIDILRHTRTVLASARLAGLTRPGGPAAGCPTTSGCSRRTFRARTGATLPAAPSPRRSCGSSATACQGSRRSRPATRCGWRSS